MAELAASIIGIVSAGTKVTLVLSQLAADVGSAGKEARMISNEIRSFCTVVKTLGETLEKVQGSQYYAHCAEMTKDMTDASLEMFTEILDASESVRSMSKGKNGKFGFVGKVQWAVFQKPKITLLRAALESYKSNLALMLGTLDTAEKVTRRVFIETTPEVIVEDEQDRSLLESLQIEHQAALIELQEANRQLKEDEATSTQKTALEETVLGFSAEVSLDSSTSPPATSGDSEISHNNSWTDSLVGSAREEIKSIRSSLSSVSTFDSDIIQAQVSRYSKRLSLLLSEDQYRLSQRWSTLLSSPFPAYSTHTELEDYGWQSGFSQHQSDNESRSFLSGVKSSVVREKRGDSQSSILAESPVPLSKGSERYSVSDSLSPSISSPYSHLTPSLFTPLGSAGAASLTPQRSSILSDTFYGVVRTWLLERPLEDRRIILGSLMNEVCTPSPKSPGTEKIPSASSPSPKDAQPESMADLIRAIPERYRPKAREIHEAVKEQIRQLDEKQKIVNPALPPSENPGITIDLGHKDIESFPEHIFEVLRGGRLERLALSHNQLRDLPQRLAFCSHLRYLNLRYNRFKTIPNPIFDLASLEILDLSRNRLADIPDAISRLKALKVFAFQRNKIDILPYVLGDMEKLQVVKYEDNPLVFPSADAMSTWKEMNPTPLTGEATVDMEVHMTARIKKYLRVIEQTQNGGRKLPWHAASAPYQTARQPPPSPPPSSLIGTETSKLYRHRRSGVFQPLLDGSQSDSDEGFRQVGAFNMPSPSSPFRSRGDSSLDILKLSSASDRRSPSKTLQLPEAQDGIGFTASTSSHQRSQSQDPHTQSQSRLLSPSVESTRRRSYLDTPDVRGKRQSVFLAPPSDSDFSESH